MVVEEATVRSIAAAVGAVMAAVVVDSKEMNLLFGCGKVSMMQREKLIYLRETVRNLPERELEKTKETCYNI